VFLFRHKLQNCAKNKDRRFIQLEKYSMCIITSEEQEAEAERWLNISKTHIFAGHGREDFQSIVYDLSIASSAHAAMILPLPVVIGDSSDVINFIDLSAYPDFFDDLNRVCVCEYDSFTTDFDSVCGGLEPESVLAVHQVGDYEASYVPSLADFDRLDSCFRLSDEVWKQMPDYKDYGFAVFQLKIVLSQEADSNDNAVHPMAFEFRARYPDRLYFPSVHVHDGAFHQSAGFMHKFFCQRDEARQEFKQQRALLQGFESTEELFLSKDSMLLASGSYDWFYSSLDVAGNVLSLDPIESLIAPDKKIYAMTLFGEYKNQDVWMGADD